MAQETFYIVGGILVVLAVAVSVLGLRSHKFPSSKPMLGIVAVLFGVVVIATAAAAVNAARDEQQTRLEEENREAEEEAEEMGEEFEEGQADQETGEAGQVEEPAAPDQLQLGEQVFVDTGCGSCHILSAAGTEGQVGPNLDETLAAQDPAVIREGIVDPDAVIADGFSAGTMPGTYGTQLSEEQLDALVTFISESTSAG